MSLQNDMLTPMFGDPRLPERFWDKVIPEPNSGCWLWLGARLGCGNGWLWDGANKKRLKVHRLAYKTLIGEIENNRDIRRMCGVVECCNPEHCRPEHLLTTDERRKHKARWARTARDNRPVLRAKKNAYAREYYQQNKEYFAVKAREQRGKNRDYFSKYMKEWRRKNPDKVKARSRVALLKRYGLVETSFRALLAAQNNACAVCASVFDLSKRKSIHIDHCHKTGTVRGLLCSPCNLAIGLLKDDVDIVLRAADYLRRTGDA